MNDLPIPPTTFPDGIERDVRTPDGRTLACLSVGTPGGPLVLHNHGGPSARLEVRLLAPAATALGLHVVGVDRPGQGRSSPQSPRTFEGWARDLTTVADAFEAERFGVTGWSEGGPWALATAAYLPAARLRHVTCIAGGCYGTFGANWAAPHLSKADAVGGMLALHFSPGFRLMYEMLELEADHFPASLRKQMREASCPYDAAYLDSDAAWATLLDGMRACFSQGAEGLVRDARVLYEAWPFDVSRVDRKVHIWQGMQDMFVPPAINRAVADAMPNAVWHGVEGGGHFIAVGEAAAILAIARDEIEG